MAGNYNLSIVVAIALICLLPLASHTEDKNSFTDPRSFASVEIQVINAKTSQPVIGARVTRLCMGDTPYATNIYHTGTNGMARIMTFTNCVLIDAKKPGYNEWQGIFFPTNGVFTNLIVTLKPVAK